MKVGVVGNPRYGDLKGILEHVALAAPYRGITLYSEPRLEPFWNRDVPTFDGVDLRDPVAAAKDRPVFELHSTP